MSQLNNIQNIAFSTAFEIDKLFPDRFIGSFTVPAAGLGSSRTATQTITNPHGTAVFAVMQWSTDNSTWFDAGNPQFPPATFPTPIHVATCRTTSSQITVIGYNATGSTITIHYRILLISEE